MPILAAINHNEMNRLFKTVLLTGLFVGCTDIMYAYIAVTIQSGKFPEGMFNYIAGGALGLDRSMQGGNGVALLGLFFHYFIAMSFTAFFFFLFPRLKFLSFNRWMIGILYGVFVNLTMRLVILPLTPLPAQPFNLSRAVFDWLIFGTVFGIPIVYNAFRYYGEKGQGQ